MVEVDQNYHVVFKQLVETISGSRQKVISVANTELLTTYWKIGRTIVEQKEKAGWGKKVIEKLANDLKAKFPNMKGLSLRNLAYMESFAAAWPFFPFTQPPVAQLPTPGQTEEHSILQPVVAKLQSYENQNIEQNQSLLIQIPWTHHIIILDRVKTLAERIFYIKETIRNGWSKNMLKVNIETRLHERKGNAITTNFDVRLSEDQAELARLTLKNPYIFDFLDIEGPMHERDLERALTKHIQRFLLELGKGFAYVGNQFNVKVQEDEFATLKRIFHYHIGVLLCKTPNDSWEGILKVC